MRLSGFVLFFALMINGFAGPGCGAPDHSVDIGGLCYHDRECKSGDCDHETDKPGVCINKCIPNGNACGPSRQRVDACCSKYCGSNGTCEAR